MAIRLKLPIKIVAAVTLIIVMIISTSSLVMIFFGMLPTFVAYIVDKTYKRCNTICVGAANFCGLFPFLQELWFGQHSMMGALIILTDLLNVAIIYLAAGLGWIVFLTLPPFIVSLQRIFDVRQVVKLKSKQKELITEWSKDVAADAQDSEVLKQMTKKSTKDNKNLDNSMPKKKKASLDNSQVPPDTTNSDLRPQTAL